MNVVDASGYQPSPETYLNEMYTAIYEATVRDIGFLSCFAACLTTGLVLGPCGSIPWQIWEQLRAIALSFTYSYLVPWYADGVTRIALVRVLLPRNVVVTVRLLGRLIPWAVVVLTAGPCWDDCRRAWVEHPYPIVPPVRIHY